MIEKTYILFVRLLRKWPKTSIPWEALIGWTVFLGGMELLGRASLNEFTDLMLVTLGFVGVATMHSFWPNGIVKRIGNFLMSLGRTLCYLDVKYGIDFRRTPEVPHRFPDPQKRLLTGLILANVAAVVIMPFFPSSLREGLRSTLCVAWLMLFGLWLIAVLFSGWCSIYMGWAAIHDRFVMAFRGQGNRPLLAERLTVAVVFSALIVAALLLPPFVPVLICLLALVAVLALSSLVGQDLLLLWQKDEDSPVYSLQGRWFGSGIAAGMILLVMPFIFISSGEAIWTSVGLAASRPETTSPVMQFIGQIFAWSCLPGVGMIVYESIRSISLGLYFNPNRDLERYREKKTEEGRQWEIDQRRKLSRGLKTLFKRKSRLNPTGGMGIVIGLQHWFIIGLSRDHGEDDPEATSVDRVIGPPYHRIFSPESRLHFWEITRALEVDLIFLEDGITFRRFTRVMRMMFEVYDIHGGRQRIEEFHFEGLPGVKAVIAEFDFASQETLGLEDYPEPDYKELARCRLLHIFKDRQEHEEPLPVPVEDDWVPVFSGV